MEGQPSTASTEESPNPSARTSTPAQLSTPLNIHHTLLSPHTSLPYHQVQLAQYNRLISSSRQDSHLQASPLPPLLSAHHIQAVCGSWSRSSSSGTGINSKAPTQGGHGNSEPQKSTKGERAPTAEKETAVKMTTKRLDWLPNPPPSHQQQQQQQQKQPTRSLSQAHNPSFAAHSSSVPSTPQHHPRNFSFESREPSPNAASSQSPRSAYSESNINLPSSRPAPPRRVCRYETALAQAKRRMPYSLGGENLERLEASSIKSKLTEDEERKLSTDMRELYDRLLPSPECELRRGKLVEKLERILNAKWPGHNTQVHVFGSSGNLLCTDSSDVDICITTEKKQMEGVCIIADLLAKSGMERVVCVSTAKVPIVKIWDPELQLACDMNVNNTLALENTRMIKTYVQIDDRVRPLAMIIKHWTKQRIVNDAAFGGTLSSYTWICMIINFLQSRSPPILPALHQRPHMKLPPKDGIESSFADDIDALRDFGRPNDETLGELLFAFFRFYAHEFDYDDLVISVRNGTQISKVDKGWHITNNNRLCVEEPFNIGRNLGNTADDTSFRGVHMELRRAFDLIAEAKLEECCAQYTFPVEGKQVFERALPPKTKVVLRSASQTSRGGRGGTQRGNRHSSHPHHRVASNRRASSGTFDTPSSFAHSFSSSLSNQDAWLQRQAQAQLHNDLYTTYSVLQAQENSLRLQLYAQGLQVQAYAQSQVHGNNGGPIKQQTADRHRTSSFDQAPLSAPLRPEMYYYPLHYQGTQLYSYPNSNTNSSSPSMGPAVPEFRRSMHRSSHVAHESELTPQPNSSLRSHSQPATRSVPPNQLTHEVGTKKTTGLGIHQGYSRQANGISIPNFIADENIEPTTDLSMSPPEESTAKEYVGYYVQENTPSPKARKATFPIIVPSFGDVAQTRRRLSTDHLPQSVLNLLRRSSRSPSPLGHDRSFSMGSHSAPLTAAPSQCNMSSSNLRALNSHGPLIDGAMPAPLSIPHWQASVNGSSTYDDPSLEVSIGSLDTNSQLSFSESEQSGDQLTGHLTPREATTAVLSEHPLVVNGSTSLRTDAEITLPIGMVVANCSGGLQSVTPNGLSPTEKSDGSRRLSPHASSRHARQVHNGAISPLDIGLGKGDNASEALYGLSPVYETRTPSPKVNRKFEAHLDCQINLDAPHSGQKKTLPPKSGPKLSASHVNENLPTTPPKLNGHIKAARSEGTGPATWQQIPKSKKKSAAANRSRSPEVGLSQREKMPVHAYDRKGG